MATFPSDTSRLTLFGIVFFTAGIPLLRTGRMFWSRNRRADWGWPAFLPVTTGLKRYRGSRLRN